MGRSLKVMISAACLLAAVTPARAAGGEEHCATVLVALEPVEGVTEARLEHIGCFSTYDQALEAGTGTWVDVSSDATPANLTAQTAAEISTASSVLIGTEFDGYDFEGASQSYFASSTCSGVVWSVANVGATWNDRFQSGKGFGGCDTNKKFQHENFGGNVRTCTPNCLDYGALTNQVTSLRWRP
jgi:hypothetical protein